MKVIKLYEEFNNDIGDICDKYNIRNYNVNADGLIDVNGSVNFHNIGLTKLPLKFNKVSGHFNCTYNHLTSLEGCPKEVDGDFFCYVNNLKSLEGCPSEIYGNFDCDNNKLISLEGGPTIVSGVFSFNNNQITSFEGVPTSHNSSFLCHGNPVFELWKLFLDYQHMELFNDLDIIREDRIIILARLNEFLDMIEKPRVSQVLGYKCI